MERGESEYNKHLPFEQWASIQKDTVYKIELKKGFLR